MSLASVLREATERNYRKWWEETFGDLDFSCWDRYRTWLLEELPDDSGGSS